MVQPLPWRLLGQLLRSLRRPGRAPGWLLLAAWLTGAGAYAQAPANDDPCGALQLTLNGSLCVTPTVGTNVGATTTTINGTVTAGCGSFNNPTPKDVWYKFTTAATGPGSAGATITVTGNPAGLLRLFAAPSCSGTFTQVNCSASNASNTAAPRLVTGALQPSTTYYVQVAGFASTDTPGQFTICVTDPPACGAPAVLGVTFPTGTSAAVSFTPGPGNTGFTAILQGGAGGQQTQANATSPVTFTGLTPGQTYFVSIRTDCGGGTLTSPFFSFTVPLLNDDPCGAISLPISGTCAPTNGTTFGAGTTTPNGYSNPGCALDASPMDVWYSFTTPASGGASTSATITVTGAPAGQIRLFSAASCSGPLTQLACSQSATGPALPLSSTTLTPSTTYYVLVAGYSDTSPRGAFTICVTGAPACPDPTNLAISGLNATAANLTFTPSAAASSYNVSYVPQGGGTPVTLTATASPVTLTGLTAGTTYVVTLQSVCPAGLGSVLTRTYTFTGGAPANDEPCAATPLTSVGIGTCGAPATATTTGATASPGVPAPGCASYSTGDVWFSVVVPANGVIQLETGPVAGSPINDTGLALYSGTCTNLSLLGCDDDSSPNGNFSLLRRAGLTAGSTVYVRVWRFGAQTGGEFTVCAQTDALCPTVTNFSVANIASTTADVTFTGNAAASSYTITYTAQGGTVTVVTPNPSGSPVTLTGLTPSTVYTVTIQANCAAGSGLPLALTFTTLAPAPANDNCAGAAALPVATTCTTVTGTTAGATASTAPIGAPGCGTGTVNDVWYALTVPANGVVQVSTSAVTGSSVTDTGLQLYSGTCGALTSLGCNDNFGSSNFSQVRATGLTPGSTVYARVWQIGGGPGGQFGLCALTDPPCPAPTNLAVGSLTPTSASVSFTGPAAGTIYTVTYTPQGGMPTTVSPAPTASPVALSGLTPGTTYTVSVTSNCAPGETSTAAVTTFNTPGCAAPTNLAAGSITTTTASLSFGAGNGSGYTLTYTPQGGPPVTLTPTASPVALSGLTPNTQYTVSLVTNCGPGQTSPAATTTFVTQPLPTCDPVTGLAATNVTSTGATLTFTPPASGASYTVTYSAQSGSAVTLVPAPTSSPVALSGLAPGTTYTVSVTSTCPNGQSSTAATITFTTAAATTCSPVSGLTATATSSTTATVSFTGVTGASSYTVTYTPAGGTATTVSPNPTASPVALTGLTAGTTYTVAVTANCGGGQSSTAVTTTLTTPAASTCPSVTSLGVSGVTANSAIVNFVPGLGNTSYQVSFITTGGTLPVIVTPNPTNAPVTITGLQPNTQYTVCVAGLCGTQLASPVCLNFTTTSSTTCAPPTNLAVSAVSSTTATLTFALSATATSYTVTYTAQGGASQTVTATTSPFLLTGLVPNTPYAVSVAANCPGGSSSTSTPNVGFTTLVSSAASAALAGTVGLYPNPAQHGFWLEVPAALTRQAVPVSLHNSVGQLVQQRTVPASGTVSKLSFDATGLPRGVYTVRLSTSQGVLVKRLVLD
jgi:hypothetical protein